MPSLKAPQWLREQLLKKSKVLLEIFMVVFLIENSLNKLDLLTPQDLVRHMYDLKTSDYRLSAL